MKEYRRLSTFNQLPDSRYENNKTTTNKHAKSRQLDSSDNYQSQNNRFLQEYIR